MFVFTNDYIPPRRNGEVVTILKGVYVVRFQEQFQFSGGIFLPRLSFKLARYIAEYLAGSFFTAGGSGEK